MACSDVLSRVEPGPALIDLRQPLAFANEFIPGSVNVPTLETFQILRRFLPLHTREFYAIAERDDALFHAVSEALPIAAWLKPDIVAAWRDSNKAVGHIDHIEAEVLAVRVAAWKTIVLDLRDREAFERSRIQDAVHVPLREMSAAVSGLPVTSSICLVCETGERSSAAASFLWNLKYKRLSILRGGFRAYVQHGFPLESCAAR
jgi:hydroxyacylglutathione hydrolase